MCGLAHVFGYVFADLSSSFAVLIRKQTDIKELWAFQQLFKSETQKED